MATAKKAHAPMALRWSAALRRNGDLPRENPGRVAVIAVASVLVGYADSDGRNCSPAIETIMREAGVSRRTARLVLGFLVADDWLRITAKANQHRPATYRLTIPEVSQEMPLEGAQRVPRSTPWNGSEGASEGAPEGAEEHPDLRPPTFREEEEEGVDARSAKAALATPSRISGNGKVGGDRIVPIDREVQAIIDDIRTHAGVGLRTEVVAPAIVEVQQRMPRLRLCPTALVVYCVELLKRQGNRVRSPSGFLAHDLRENLGAAYSWSPRMQLAERLEVLRGDVGLIEKAELDLRHQDPLFSLHYLLEQQELAEEGGWFNSVPSAWEAKPAQVEKWLQAVRQVLSDTDPFLKKARLMIGQQTGASP